MLISITELQCKSIWKLPKFIIHSSRAAKQVKLAKGNIYNKVWNKGLTGFTYTAWESKEDMLAFRNSGAHKKAMPAINKLATRYRNTNWQADEFPTVEQALLQLQKLQYRYS